MSHAAYRALRIKPCTEQICCKCFLLLMLLLIFWLYRSTGYKLFLLSSLNSQGNSPEGQIWQSCNLWQVVKKLQNWVRASFWQHFKFSPGTILTSPWSRWTRRTHLAGSGIPGSSYWIIPLLSVNLSGRHWSHGLFFPHFFPFSPLGYKNRAGYPSLPPYLLSFE